MQDATNDTNGAGSSRPFSDGRIMVVALKGWNDAGEAASSAVTTLASALRINHRAAMIEDEEFFDYSINRPHSVRTRTGERRILWPHVALMTPSTEDGTADPDELALTLDLEASSDLVAEPGDVPLFSLGTGDDDGEAVIVGDAAGDDSESGPADGEPAGGTSAHGAADRGDSATSDDDASPADRTSPNDASDRDADADRDDDADRNDDADRGSARDGDSDRDDAHDRNLASDAEMRVTGANGDNLLVLLGHEPTLRWRAFTDRVLELCEEHGVTRLVLVGALLADVPHSRPIGVFVSSEDQQFRDELAVSRSEYQGPTGVLAALGDLAQGRGIPSVSVWASVPHYASQPPSPKAELAVVDKLEELLDVTIPRAKLIEHAEQWEDEVDAATGEDNEIAEYIDYLERAHDMVEAPEASGEAIAKEFERFLRQGDGRGDAARGPQSAAGWTGPIAKPGAGRAGEVATGDLSPSAGAEDAAEGADGADADGADTGNGAGDANGGGNDTDASDASGDDEARSDRAGQGHPEDDSAGDDPAGDDPADSPDESDAPEGDPDNPRDSE